MLSKVLHQQMRLAQMPARNHTHVLSLDTISKTIVDTQYAVKGEIEQEGDKIRLAMKHGHKFDFDQIAPLNVGNPQAAGGQGYITFYRNILAALINPALIERGAFHRDVVDKVEELKARMATPVGAYTSNSKGYGFVQEKIAEFISKRDGGIETDPQRIYCTNGASGGCKLAMNMLSRNRGDGVFLPVPSYPLYEAQLSLMSGRICHYYLEEEDGWGMNVSDIEQRIIKAKNADINVRALVVINPNNPTGSVLSRQNIEDLIRVCHKHSVLILADEVYQENIYNDELPFHSFRGVLASMEGSIPNEVELLSLHSISKGITGESGFRGGYIETHNIDETVEEMMYKLRSIELCSNTIGQIAMALKVDPPRRGVQSDETMDQFEEEIETIKNSQKKASSIIEDYLGKMDGVSVTPFNGAMYAFPSLDLPDRAIEAAQKARLDPDFHYCLQLLHETGIQTVPGSGFGQKIGTYHLRLSNNVSSEERMVQIMESIDKFNSRFHKKYRAL